MAFTDSSYGLFQGALYVQERGLNGANLTGYQFLGDTDMFTIDPKQKFDNIEESQTGLGLTSAHIVTGTEVMCKFRALDIKMANWVRATWGGGGTAIASGSVTGESVTMCADVSPSPVWDSSILSNFCFGSIVNISVSPRNWKPVRFAPLRPRSCT